MAINELGRGQSGKGGPKQMKKPNPLEQVTIDEIEVPEEETYSLSLDAPKDVIIDEIEAPEEETIGLSVSLDSTDDVVDTTTDTTTTEDDSTSEIDDLITKQTNVAFDRLGASAESARLAAAQRIAASSTMTAGAKRAASAGLERDISSATAEAAADASIANSKLKIDQKNKDDAFKLQEDLAKGYWTEDPETGEQSWVMGTSQIQAMIANTNNSKSLLELNEMGSTSTGTALADYIGIYKGTITDVTGDGLVNAEDWLKDGVFMEKVKKWWEFSGDGKEWTGSDAQVSFLNKTINTVTPSAMNKKIEEWKQDIGYYNMSDEDKAIHDGFFEDQKQIAVFGGDIQNIYGEDGQVIGMKVVNLLTNEAVGEPQYYDGFSAEDEVNFEEEVDPEEASTDYTYDANLGTVTATNAAGDTEILDWDPTVVLTAFAPVGDTILDAGRDANPDLYDAVVTSRSEFVIDDMMDSGTFVFKDNWNIEEGSDVYNTIANDPRVSKNSMGGKKLAEDNYSSKEEFQYFGGLTQPFANGPNANGDLYTDIIDPGTPIMLDMGDYRTPDGTTKMFIYKKTILHNKGGNDELEYRFIDPLTGDEYKLFVGNDGRKNSLKKDSESIIFPVKV